MRNLHSLNFSPPIVRVNPSFDHFSVFCILLGHGLDLLFNVFSDIFVFGHVLVHHSEIHYVTISILIIISFLVLFFIVIWEYWLLELESGVLKGKVRKLGEGRSDSFSTSLKKSNWSKLTDFSLVAGKLRVMPNFLRSRIILFETVLGSSYWFHPDAFEPHYPSSHRVSDTKYMNYSCGLMLIPK